jgi:ABC-2 type transport system ATP-binding protein
MNDTVIEVQGLVKHFNGVAAVKGINFTVQSGELFGFLGPNGAGKTTTVRLLTGVLEPTKGTAAIQGHDIISQSLLSRAHIAVVPEEANVYPDLSVWQNIMLMAELYGIPRKKRNRKAVELLDLLSLKERTRQKARTLSKGLRQRLMLCAALVTEPEILFMDEPTSGLDVHSKQMMHQIMRQLNSEGLTVFLTTHNMEEAEKMCTRVAIISDGQIAAIDTPEALRSVIKSRQFVEVSFSGQPAIQEELLSLPGVTSANVIDNAVRLYSQAPGKTASEVVYYAKSKNLRIEQLCTKKPSLEEVFIYLTGRDKRESLQ